MAPAEQQQLKKVARDASHLAVEQAKGLSTQVRTSAHMAADVRRVMLPPELGASRCRVNCPGGDNCRAAEEACEDASQLAMRQARGVSSHVADW